jgi:DNA-binding MarR family transcriptional regulator
MTTSTSKKENGRLSPAQWLEIEVLYQGGATQKELAEKYGVRIETISRHMTRLGIKGNEKQALVKKELELALLKKKREFAETRAQREIEAKDGLFRLQSALLSTWGREFRALVEDKKPLGALAASAKAMKEATAALKGVREEMWELLGIQPDDNSDELPDLHVAAFSPAEEQALRDAKATALDDEDDPDAPDAETLALLDGVEAELSGESDE